MKIFLSAVSAQFKASRDALASDLRAVGAHVVVQEDFQQHGRTLLEKLEQFINDCDRVIALVGDAYGWEPNANALPAEKPRCSYTQWEYRFAQGERLAGADQPAKDTFVYLASPEFLATCRVDEPADAAALQQAFLAKILESGKDRNLFGSLHELRALVLRDVRLENRRLPSRDRADDQPELVLDLFDAAPSTRFFYGARRVPCLGRKTELGDLQSFLDGPNRFVWWLLCGPAGVGKHRIALELCLQNREAWRVGWLGSPPAVGWSAWQPAAPTLMIIDDVATKAEVIRELAIALFRRREVLDHPVRVLLLEREPRGMWHDRFIGAGGERHGVESSRFAAPLELAGLGEPEVWEIIRIILAAQGSEVPDQRATLAAFQEIDPRGRPLYAAFAADAIAAGRTLKQWDEKELLASVLKTERERRWAPAGVTEEDQNLMALATMTGGLPVTILKHPPVPGVLPRSRDYSPERYREMSGRPAERRLAPLAPSVLGDFFVLDHLAPTSDVDERADLMRTAALEILRVASSASEEDTRTDDLGVPIRPYIWFFEQAARTFPGHLTLLHLRMPPPTNEGSTTFQWGIDAANLIETLDEESNGELCRQILADLRQVAFPRKGTGLGTLRYRTAKAAVVLLVRGAVRGDREAVWAHYRDLKTMAVADRSLLRQLAAGGAALVMLLACREQLKDAAEVYEELRDAVGSEPDAAETSVALAKAAGALVAHNAKMGQLTVAHDRYEEIKTLADRGSAPGDGPRFELRLEQAKAAASLIEAHANAGDMLSARQLYEKLRELAAEHNSRQESPSLPEPIVPPSAGEAALGALLSSVLELGLRHLVGQGGSPRPGLDARDEGAALTERRAYAAIALVRGYGASRDFDGAAEICEELRTIAVPAQHPKVLSHWGQATYCLLVAFLEDRQLSSARAAYDELIKIASVHGPTVVPIKARAAALHAMIYSYIEAGDGGAAAVIAKGSADFVQNASTRPTVQELYGESACENFYQLIDRLMSRSVTAAGDISP